MKRQSNPINYSRPTINLVCRKLKKPMNNALTTLSLLLSIFLFGIPQNILAQELPIAKIKSQIQEYKKDPRGPYKRIQWFCKDGTMREPKDPCPEKIGGNQHASYKDEVKALAAKHHLFFGEILTGTPVEAFLDQQNYFSRLKQYQMNKYLQSVDDGWIQQKSQFYRGAVQSEDEEEWGIDFYHQILKDDRFVEANYYLLKQSLRDIPHDGDSNLAQDMRSLSKSLADAYSPFMDLRIKIHGNPTKADIPAVQQFKDAHKGKLKTAHLKTIDDLITTMEEYYAPIDTKSLKKDIERISSANPARGRLIEFTENLQTSSSPESVVATLADLLCVVRTTLTQKSSSKDRLLLLDISNSIEDYLLKSTQEWKPETLQDLMEKIRYLGLAAAGSGLIELWEWEEIEPRMELYLGKSKLTLDEINQFLQTSRSIVEWSASMVKANYNETVDLYNNFEPMATGFIDDRVRSSAALDLGENVSKLGNLFAEMSNISNNVLQIDGQSNIRGLNPGYALGELVVVKEISEDLHIDSNKIYVFQKPPSDLKPVAGIMTVSEGNLVSHVQLLARNLGIPNAALSDDNLKDLSKFSGKTVFMAVSEKGNVIMKEANDMTETEKALFSKTERQNTKIAVPVGQIRLDVKEVLNMRAVDAKDSGKLCGPKAANLGQLKAMFPENVVEGLIIPFGIFKSHMEKPMPNQSMSYWAYLLQTFEQAEAMRKKRESESAVESYQLQRLATLRAAMEKIELDAAFVNNLQQQFRKVFGANMGEVPVFLRSDTNMEDLKEFTGAGLNLTLFNIVSSEAILEGIKKVWASPYTERSFKWRQKYLSNPENVYPSILIIPSVDVEHSGVMITKGVNSGNEDDLTVAFSRGAGGAVDGQIAETRIITSSADELVAPAREPKYLRLPKSGGTSKYATTFERSILSKKNISDLRSIANDAKRILPKTMDADYKGAWDIELGFSNDKIWLFQIRPFVENKRAKSSDYLAAIAPKIDTNTLVSIKTKI